RQVYKSQVCRRKCFGESQHQRPAIYQTFSLYVCALRFCRYLLNTLSHRRHWRNPYRTLLSWKETSTPPSSDTETLGMPRGRVVVADSCLSNSLCSNLLSP